LGPKNSLSTWDAVALIVGIVVGAGIFRAPQFVAQYSSGPLTFLLFWLAGGAISLVGAMCYAELASAFPHAGGDYHFLRRAYGRNVSFVFAWSRSLVIQTGGIAGLAFVFADYVVPVFALAADAAPWLAALAVVSLTLINMRELRYGRGAQKLLTTVQVCGLLLVILAGSLVGIFHPGGATPAPEAAPSTPAIGMAMVFVLFTFGGWSEAAYISAEVHDDRKGIARALLGGLGIITLLYMLANMAYLSALGHAGIAGSQVVAADLMNAALGKWGALALSVIVAASALCSANATIVTGSRGGYAFGRDYSMFGFLATWQEGASSPANSLLAQGGIALVLIAFGAVTRNGFEAMVAYTAPVFWLFLALVSLAVIILRHKLPDTPRPFRVPLYPFTPILFLVTSLFMLYSTLNYAGVGALLGIAVMLCGVPVMIAAGARNRIARGAAGGGAAEAESA
jgi:amino acid transporter